MPVTGLRCVGKYSPSYLGKHIYKIVPRTFQSWQNLRVSNEIIDPTL